MPKDNSLEPVKLPMTIRFNERPTTRFLNNLESIDVQLIESPTLNDLRNYLVPFLEATWSDNMFDSRFMTIQEIYNLATKVGGSIVKWTGAFSYVKRVMHPDRYGGASFLGLSQPFIKGHGASTSFAIKTAIDLAYNSANNYSNEKIIEELDRIKYAH